MKELFIILAVASLFSGACVYLRRKGWLFFLVFLALAIKVAITNWQNQCYWPVFILWAIVAFLSFLELEEEKKKDPKIVFPIALIGLYVTGNVLGFCYGLMWPLVVVSIMEFFTVLGIIFSFFPTSPTAAEYFAEFFD